MRWPKFGCIEELEQEHWEFGGPTILPGLLLHGSSGTGKTTTAYLAIRQSLDCWDSFENGVPDVVAWRAVEMGRMISELSRTGGEELQDFLNQIANAGLLFIDDFDKARFTPRVESELFDLLEYRETQSLPVVVTTNIKGRELEKMFSRHIGPAIVNRLRRMCLPIDFDAPGFDAEDRLCENLNRHMERAGNPVECFPGGDEGFDLGRIDRLGNLATITCQLREDDPCLPSGFRQFHEIAPLPASGAVVGDLMKCFSPDAEVVYFDRLASVGYFGGPTHDFERMHMSIDPPCRFVMFLSCNGHFAR